METTENMKRIKLPQTITVKKFSETLGVSVIKVITELLRNKIIANINEEIDFDTASIIAQDLGFETEEEKQEIENESMTLEKLVEICKKEKEQKENVQSRPPIVTILGHVDHGKTTLLDTIRKTNIAEKEVGGITQHIRAYQVRKKGKLITFVDTPGHEAFSAMRERGVSIADIAILVVAADDGVRPQTKEVAQYLKEKKIPTIVAINKIDKPQANVARVKQELSDLGILIEEWGGNVMSAEVSAKQNIGIDDLLERILLLAEIEDFKADYKRDGLAVVLESHLDPKKGSVATVLIKTGTLKVGQDIVAGSTFGRIRKIEDYAGKNLSMAGPSLPVTIMGLNNIPQTNDIVQIINEKENLKIMSKEWIGRGLRKRKDLGKEKLHDAISEENMKKIQIILKVDVQGSLEAIEQILSTIKTEEVSLEYIGTGVGNITESDVKIASNSRSVILGFNVMATAVAKRMADDSGVKIKIFSIIYELVEEVKKMMTEMLPPNIIRIDFGRLNVLAVFKTGKRDMIIGGRVSEGKAVKGSQIEVKRGEEIIGKGNLSNLQQNKNATKEVGQGNECGITFDGNVKIKEGDTLIFYKEEIKKRTL